MDIGADDLSLLVYNFGVSVVGGWVTMQLGGEVVPTVFGVLFLVSIGWTMYFQHSMVPRLARFDSDEVADSPVE